MIPKKILYIDDDTSSLELVKVMLGKDSEVRTCPDSREAMSLIRSFRPDMLITDLTMPGKDGLDICRQVREDPELAGLTVVVVSAKPYESDRNNALRAGADGYLVKPVSLQKFQRLLESMSQVKATLWGVRGTLPVPNQGYTAYGGNTICATLEVPGERLFIFDAGTGIKQFSSHLLRTGRKRIKAHLFISHAHWDHINAFPFFVPFFIPGNDITVYGARQGKRDFRRVMEDQMDGDYFPITVREFAARVEFTEISQGDHEVEGIRVRTLSLKHPNNCLGYRVEAEGKVFCYVTDNELYLPDGEFHDPHFWDQLRDFTRGADMLLHDATYHDQEYRSKIHWGHSCVSQVARLAHEAEVKNLYLFHHDPDQDDKSIAQKLEQASKSLAGWGSSTRCHLAAEQQPVLL